MITSRRIAPLLLLLAGLAVLALAVALTVHAQSQEVTATAAATGASPPAKPTSLQASAKHDSVTLTWTASTDQTVTHYAILRRNPDVDASQVFHVIESNAGPGTSYTDGSVSASTTYIYRAKAVSPTGVSQWSGYVQADTPAAPDPTPTPAPTPTATPEPDPEPETDPADLAPTGLSAALAEGGGVTLSWSDPAEDAGSVTGYEVLRAVGQGELATLKADTGSTATAYADATATQSGTSYTYKVKAIRGEDRSQASGQAQVQLPHDPADLRPTGLAVSLVDNKVTLSWTAPSEDADSVDGYEILRRRPMEGETTLATLVADTESTATAYTDATANEPGVRYVYRVKALRGGDVSLWSNFDRIDLPADYVPDPTPTPEQESTSDDEAPTGLSAALAEGGVVALSWTAPSDDADSVTGYEILRAVGEGEMTTLVADTASTTTTYTDATATDAGETYAYQVKAIRGEDRSEASGQAEAQVPHDPVDLAPTGLTAVILTGSVVVVGEEESTATTAVRLTWTAPAEDAGSVTGYEILRAVGDGEIATLAADTGSTATSYTDATATEASETYAYKVKAIRGDDRSQASGQVQVQLPDDPVDLAPSDLTAEAVDGGVDLSWTAPAEDADSVTGYEVLRAVGEGDMATLVADTASTTTTYTDATATGEGETYAYRVKAIRGEARSQGSNRVSLVPVEPPATPENLKPTNLTFEIREDGVTLAWDAPAADADSVTGYRVVRRRPNQGENEWLVWKWDTGSTETTYWDGYARTHGEFYMYRVRALRGDDHSKLSNRVDVRRPEAAPQTAEWAPSNLVAQLYVEIAPGEEEPTPAQVKLAWDAPAEGTESIGGYEVQRATCDGDFAALAADTGSTDTAYTDAGVEAGESYTYRVRARRPQGLSLVSNQRTLLLPGGTGESECAAPTHLLSQVQDPQTGLLTPATLLNTLLGYDEAEGTGTLAPNELTFDEDGAFRVTSVNVWPGVPGLVLMLTGGTSAQDAALADRDFILEADETVLVVGTTEFSFDDALVTHSDTKGDNGEYTGVVIVTWTDGESGLVAGETVDFRLVLRDRPEEAQFSQHDTDVVLVRNTGVGVADGSASLTSSFPKRAQGFNTGANVPGYALSGIGIKFNAIDNTSTADSHLTVTLNANSNGNPGASLCTLTNPSSFTSSGVHTFDAPTTDPCPTLAASTTYFLVVERVTFTTDKIEVNIADSGDQDPDSAAGWSIGNDRHYLASGGTWDKTFGAKSIVVRGAVLPPPPPPALIKNTGQTSHTTASDGLDATTIKRAQAFTTGAEANGYTLSSIGVKFFTIAQPSTAGSQLVATLNADNNGNPGASLCTLSGPETFTGSGVQTFDAPTGCPTLAASTPYFVVIERVTNTADAIRLALAQSTNEDTGGATGWSVGNKRHLVASGGSWSTQSSDPYQIEVRGAVAPPPPPPTLVKNTGQTRWRVGAPLWQSVPKRAQAFTTGAEANGYTLDSIGIRFDFINPSRTHMLVIGSQLTVTLNADSGGNPGAALCTLSDPSRFTAYAVNTFDAPATCPALAANTTYFVVIARSIVTGFGDLKLKLTSSAREDNGGAAGWSIKNSYHYFQSESWHKAASHPLMIRIDGVAVGGLPIEIEPSGDLDTLREAGNDSPRGIWSDGTTMWVVNSPNAFSVTEVKIYAYNLATKARDADEDFNTLIAAGNTIPRGLWSNGTTMWVADEGQNKIFAYDMATKQRVPGEDFSALYYERRDSATPKGIWSDGETMWVAHDVFSDLMIYAYDLDDKTRLPDRSISLRNSGNSGATGLWGDGATIFVGDDDDDRIYAYWPSNSAPNPDRYISLSGANERSDGIWSDGDTIWVSDLDDGKIYVYALPASVAPPGTLSVEHVTDTMALVKVDISELVRAYGREELAVSIQVLGTLSSATMYVHPEGGYAKFLLLGLRPETQYTVVASYGVVAQYNLGDVGREVFRTDYARLAGIETSGLTHTEATVTVPLNAAGLDRGCCFKFYPHSNKEEGERQYTFYLRHKAGDDTAWSNPVKLTFSDFTAEAKLTGLEPGTVYDVEVAETEDFMPPQGSAGSYQGTLTVATDMYAGIGFDQVGLYGGSLPPYGSLSPTTFKLGGVDHSIVDLYVVVQGSFYFHSSEHGKLVLRFDRALPDYAAFTLTVGTDVFNSADATVSFSGQTYNWAAGPTLTDGESVAVELAFTGAVPFREGTTLEGTFTTPPMPPTLAFDAEMTVGVDINFDGYGNVGSISQGSLFPRNTFEVGGVRHLVEYAGFEKGTSNLFALQVVPALPFDRFTLTMGSTELPVGTDTGLLVKNTRQSSIRTFEFQSSTTLSNQASHMAQQFTTGANNTGYTLSSIGLRFGTISNTSTVGSELTMTLNADNSGNPGNVLCTLTDPTSFTSAAVNTFDAPTTCSPLAAQTSYFVVIERVTLSSGTIEVSPTNSPNEDSGGAAGWSIRNTNHYIEGGLTIWVETHPNLGNPLMIEVRSAAALPAASVTVDTDGKGLYTWSGRTNPSWSDAQKVDVKLDIGLINICDRSPAVAHAIKEATPSFDYCHMTSPLDLDDITTLRIPNGRGTGLKAGDFEGLSGLTHLDLSWYGLGGLRPQLPVGVFDGLDSLTHLDISHNHLMSLDRGVFDGLDNLTHLDLSDTSLQKLYVPVGVFDPLDNLEVLRLSSEAQYYRRSFSNLDDDLFMGLANLEELDVGESTPLRDSPRSLLPLTSLETYNGRSYTRPADPPANFQYASGRIDHELGYSKTCYTVTLKWDAPTGVTGITGYRVLRNLGAESPNRYAKQIATTGASARSFVDGRDAGVCFDGVGSGPNVSYFVSAIIGNKDSFPARVRVNQTQAFSTSQVPSTPTLRGSLYAEDYKVRLEWDDPSDPNISGYEISFRGSGTAAWRTIVANAGNVLEYDLESIPRLPSSVQRTAENTFVYNAFRDGGSSFGFTDGREFRIRALNAHGHSGWSNVVRPFR